MDQPAKPTLEPSYFEKIYNDNPDPWGFETREYEASKYANTIAALPKDRYRNAFEIGCSIGVLTRKLADRCDALLAVDVVQQALDRAIERCRDQGQVRFQLMRVPDKFPADQFDLIVLSEVGYYWTEADLLRATDQIVDHLLPGGNAVLVHWTPVAEDYPLRGDEVHDLFAAQTRNTLRHVAGQREDEYRLDVFERRS